jgi:tRNA threonylcarbamoyladenosine biosynthesis protein TsaE
VAKVNSVEEMRSLGASLAAQLRAGDLIVLDGPLGAGKTALTQGIATGLGISDVTSPTFVIARTHQGKIPLIHVDAYRLLGSTHQNFEFDDLDLDTNRESAITIIEWGSAVAPLLDSDFLQITIEFGAGENERILTSTAHGNRWQGVTL